MKVSVLVAIAIVFGLGVGYSNNSWSGDLDAALEKINISTDAQDAAKKDETDARPCIIAKGATCATSYNDVNDVNGTNAREASAVAVQSAISGNTIPAATINGVSAGEVGNKGAGPIGGF
jgi:hypothetical protein